MKSCDLIIVGGGASGLTAAVEYKRNAQNSSVLVLEQMPRAGKKLLVTGNGRCNLGNNGYYEHEYTNAAFAREVFKRFDGRGMIAFFESLGLCVTADAEGRLYPLSNTAASVLDALRYECEGAGVVIRCGYKVERISKRNGGFVVNDEYFCEKLILAGGGKAAPVHGSDGSCIALAEGLGLRSTPLYPALVQLVTASDKIRSLKGQRVKAGLSITGGGESSGEVLFTDYGLSGIAAMDLSRYYDPNVKQTVTVSMLPGYDVDRVYNYIQYIVRNKPHLPAENLLTGMLPKAVGVALIKAATGRLPDKTGAFTEKESGTIAGTVKNFRLPLLGLRGFNDAQVTRGGLDVSCFRAGTLKAADIPGLFACGEILDVDGACGGYNLQWAFASGRAAGHSAAGKRAGAGVERKKRD